MTWLMMVLDSVGCHEGDLCSKSAGPSEEGACVGNGLVRYHMDKNKEQPVHNTGNRTGPGI